MDITGLYGVIYASGPLNPATVLRSWSWMSAGRILNKMSCRSSDRGNQLDFNVEPPCPCHPPSTSPASLSTSSSTCPRMTPDERERAAFTGGPLWKLLAYEVLRGARDRSQHPPACGPHGVLPRRHRVPRQPRRCDYRPRIGRDPWVPHRRPLRRARHPLRARCGQRARTNGCGSCCAQRSPLRRSTTPSARGRWDAPGTREH
ncbi:hypothetical protein FB451DRAFT_1378200 [Mycena latifolia]|nr:hypothetical protein FB451DRAFT_1378200 [Mycena latifolia]